MQAKSSFFVLQALDLATTLVAFHFGAFEVNPLVGRLTALLGPTGGVWQVRWWPCSSHCDYGNCCGWRTCFISVSFAGTHL